ncbi:SufE family protein [Psychrosphaera sp. F3M07]|uniref:SufE family protein n=1 Tax=Psychrosphaera sp. F3M07 TaxID=2841560 RepID=UPI001C095F97|nr:SufE family protein [Psychrosphaera sp. F3M07]MBU2917709.1 SufE family protein [Psychrosphaera sp. F3M07]
MPTNPKIIIELGEQFELNEVAVIELFSPLKNWEEKFRQLMLLGKKLPILPIDHQLDEYLVSGCESKVWLVHQWHNQTLSLAATSDAKIVKGLIAVVLAAFNNKTKTQIIEFNLDNYFAQLNLLNQLSPSRANGVHAIINEIKSFVDNVH